MDEATRGQVINDLGKSSGAIALVPLLETFLRNADYTTDLSDESSVVNGDCPSNRSPDCAMSSEANSWSSTSMPWRIVSIQTEIDPRTLQVNRRFHKSHALPPDVRKSMLQLAEKAHHIMTSQMPFETGTFNKKTRFSCRLTFTFPTLGSDIDGPVKRTIDATFRGMREALDDPNINDTRIVELWITKRVGTPSLAIEVDVVA